METSDQTRKDNLTPTEQSAILTNRAAAVRPQPVDYGLTYDALDRNNLATPAGLTYKESSGWKLFFAIWLPVYLVVFALLAPNLRGTVSEFVLLFFVGLIVGGWLVVVYVYPIVWGVVRACIAAYERRHPSAAMLAYRRALQLHELYVAAERQAERTAHEVERALLRQKRSYWEGLDGYEFERATAEVLKQHQFNPRVTGGSADGGVDIEVTRSDRKGVVQCKAHVACVGPHTVRDLFGVMHHSRADFGIIVSRGGFTKGAIDFARNKPIFFVDTSDLIAMQEGRDVLARGFTRADPSLENHSL